MNKWLSEDCTCYGGSKGAPDIVGRIDKLGIDFIEHYFLDNDIVATYEEMQRFLEKIRNYWRNNK
jgi:hypothetical protein